MIFALIGLIGGIIYGGGALIARIAWKWLERQQKR